jgi:hypothetical protein
VPLQAGGIGSSEAHGSGAFRGAIRSWRPYNWRNINGIIREVGGVATAEIFGSMSISAISGGATIWADSPSLADVRAAIASANESDTVRIPSGSATWTEQLVVNKAVNVIAAGIDSTIITSNYAAPSLGNVLTSSNYLIYYTPTTPANNKPFRISGLTIELENKCYGIMLKDLSYLYPQTKVRLDHIRMTNTGGTWQDVLVHVYGPIYGVSDHCDWGIGYMRCNSLDSDAWTYLTFEFGTADNFYFEDSAFAAPDTMFLYGEMGGRYCARFNTFDGTASTNGLYPFADMHGNQPNSGHNATMGVEMYENIINVGTRGCCLLDQRGGKALIYNNIVNTSGSVSSKLREEYLDSSIPPANNVISGQPQHVSSSYYWNNKKNGTTLITPYVAQTTDYGGSIGLVPQLNIDAWAEVASFDGSVGVGRGLLSARPSSGLTVGVGYWATDEKKLYRAIGPSSWELYYQPYTYPHPLAV